MDNTSITDDVQLRSTRHIPGQQFTESKLNQIVSFILAHRSKSAFEGWDKEQIDRSVYVSNLHGRLYVSYGRGGCVNGVLVAFHNSYDQVWIDGFIALDNTVFRELALMFVRHNRFLHVLGNRHGKVKEFDLSGLEKQLTKE